MPLANLIDLTITCMITVWSPGPNNILLLSTASRYGVKKNMPLMAGIWTGATVVMTLCGLLGQTLISVIPGIQPVMKMIGGAYLLYLAWNTYKRQPPSAAAEQKLPTYFMGFFLQLVNAKMIIHGITMFSSYILPFVQTTPMILLFVVYFVIMGAIGNLLWAFAGNVLTKVYNNHYKLMNLVMALLLVWCALRILGLC